MAEIPILLYYLFNFVFLWTFGSLLTIKSVKKKFGNVVFFGIAILINGCFFAIKFIYFFFDIKVGRVSIPEIFYVASLIPGIIFVKKTFYANKNRPIIRLAWIAYMISASIAITAGFLEDFAPGGFLFKPIRYIVDDLVIFPAVFMWNVVNGIRAYKQNVKATTRFVRLRFIYFALGHVAGIASGFFDYLSGIVDTGLYDFYAPFSVFCAIFYGLFMYLTWFTPAILNKATRNNAQYIPIQPIESSVESERSNTQGASSTANLSEKMRVIEHFGTILSHYIGKSPAACSGLIFICMGDYLGTESIYPMGIKDLEAVISHVLPGKLEMLGVPGAKEGIDALKQELTTNISLLTMSMF